jgi:hypothetical protein
VVATNAAGCGIAPELVYHPVSNPTGARCTIFDINVNSYGRNPSTGAARRPLDNVGVEYGRQALVERVITPSQFIELNHGIGGYDDDGEIRAARSSASVDAISLAYATGRVNGGFGSLNATAILQYRRYSDMRGDIHDRLRDFAIRDRLTRANGRADNQVIWVAGPTSPGLGIPALTTMTDWLDAVIRDPTPDPLPIKVARAKPAAAVDACWEQDTRIDDRDGRCRTLYPPHGNPRVAAGGPVSGLVLKCQRRPLRPEDYAGISFDDAQWRQLHSVFPDGVCDYSKPGVGQAPPAGLKLPLTSSR